MEIDLGLDGELFWVHLLVDWEHLLPIQVAITEQGR